jgi:hypothetical protein
MASEFEDVMVPESRVLLIMTGAPSILHPEASDLADDINQGGQSVCGLHQTDSFQ